MQMKFLYLPSNTTVHVDAIACIEVTTDVLDKPMIIITFTVGAKLYFTGDNYYIAAAILVRYGLLKEVEVTIGLEVTVVTKWKPDVFSHAVVGNPHIPDTWHTEYLGVSVETLTNSNCVNLRETKVNAISGKKKENLIIRCLWVMHPETKEPLHKLDWE